MKFRKGDVGLKIQSDGKLELAGVTPDMPMIDSKGNVNPALLFAAAWARKDEKVFEVLVQNFKESVKEGIFGEDAQEEFIATYRSKMQEVTQGANIEPSVQPVQPPSPTVPSMPVPTPDSTFDTSKPMTVEDQLRDISPRGN
jgi:hypothetical protein